MTPQELTNRAKEHIKKKKVKEKIKIPIIKAMLPSTSESSFWKDVFSTLLEYIDAKIEYEFESREVDSSGYTTSAPEQKKKADNAKKKLSKFFGE